MHRNEEQVRSSTESHLHNLNSGKQINSDKPSYYPEYLKEYMSTIGVHFHLVSKNRQLYRSSDSIPPAGVSDLIPKMVDTQVYSPGPAYAKHVGCGDGLKKGCTPDPCANTFHRESGHTSHSKRGRTCGERQNDLSEVVCWGMRLRLPYIPRSRLLSADMKLATRTVNSSEAFRRPRRSIRISSLLKVC